MLIRLITLSLLLLAAVGCSNNTSPLQPATATNEEKKADPVPPTRVLVLGDASAPKLAKYLRDKKLNAVDVPNTRYVASDDLEIAGDYIVWSDNRNDTGDGNLDIYAYQISTSTEFVVTKAAGKQWLPSIAGDYIVWEDYRSGNADIYGYRISTKTVFPVIVADQNQLFPETDGVNVVWHDLRGGDANIYRFELGGAGSVIGVETGAGDQWYPQVSGDYIVWQDYLGGYNDVYLYQISTGTKTNLTAGTASSSQYQPQLRGDYVVWMSNQNVDDDLYGYRISTASPLDVAVQAGQQRNPRISGNGKWIVWQDNRNGNFDIYGYDLLTATEKQLSPNSADQILPQISGDLVVWQDKRAVDGNYDIYAYSFATDSEYRITSNTTDQTRPQLSNGRVIWLDERRGVKDVMWSNDLGGTLGLATSTWLTPAGMIGDISSYDVVVFANDFISEAVMLNLYDAALAAGIGVVGLGGNGMSLAKALANATPKRYGISVVADKSGCAPMQIRTIVTPEDQHRLFVGINVSGLVRLEDFGATTMDELAITTDASLAGSPASWTTQAIFGSAMCNIGKDALIEFTDGRSKVMLDGTATMTDGYTYWNGDRWDLFLNEVVYVIPRKK